MPVVARALINVYRLLTWPLWALLRRTRKRGGWVELTLHGAVEELRPARPSGLSGLLARLRSRSPSVAELRSLAERLKSDASVEGLLLTVSSLRSGWATLHGLFGALRELSGAGKRVVVLLPEGAAQRELLVACAGSQVVAPPNVGISVLGPAAQRTYVAPLLARAGIQVDVVAQGRYKTAAEALVRDSMSEAEREQSDALVAALKATLEQALVQRLAGRSSPEQLFREALFGAQAAQRAGLLDQCAYRDQLEATLGLSDDKRPLTPRDYLRKTRPFTLLPLRRRPRIAVLSLHGPIGDVSSSRSVGLEPTSAAIASLRQREDICGVLLHIDSPGGSAVVSDLLHHELSRLAQKKPVVAWLGNVAASGGYYLAAAAPRIVADACTITGSIGVISAHFVAASLLQRLGVHSEVVKHTPHADLGAMSRPLRPDERALFAGESERFYDRFLQVVAEGRSLPRERVHELAQGRVWSGRDAKACGLVDVLGGYETALAELRALLGAANIEADTSEPLVVQPTRSGGLLRSQAALLPSALEHARTLLELARADCKVLAYAPHAVELLG